jgi:hypothetical protein
VVIAKAAALGEEFAVEEDLTELLAAMQPAIIPAAAIPKTTHSGPIFLFMFPGPKSPRLPCTQSFRSIIRVDLDLVVVASAERP